MREPIKLGDAGISRRVAEKSTDWNARLLGQTSVMDLPVDVPFELLSASSL